MIRAEREKFYDRQVQMMKTPGMLPFKAIKRLQDSENKPRWQLTDLYPGDSEEKALETAADYFSSIAAEFDPLTDDSLPASYDRPPRIIDVGYVEESLRNIKKPKSYISIDIPPEVLSLCHAQLVTALAPIYNIILNSEWWPQIWKAEEVTIIPKNSRPESIDQTRNISCTSIFSKLAEEFLMGDLKSEVKLSDSQFGGRKGCGTEHLLAELSTEIMAALDDNRACVTLMSLDYSKAFNRMSHGHCLRNLKKHGASNQTLATTFGFLKDRTIKIKSQANFSNPRKMPGGAPQGTKSGNFLFSMTADDLDSHPDATLHEESNISDFIMEDLNNTDENTSKYDRTFDFSLNIAPYDRRTNPTHNPLDDTRPHHLLSAWPQHKIGDALGAPERWIQRPLKSFKYVDDQTVIEVSPITAAVSTIGSGKEKRFIHAEGLSREYQKIDAAATAIGMKLNLQKTQILTISASKNYEISSYLRIGDQVIQSQDRMKILGYVLDASPGARAQVMEIKKKSARKSWTIRHLIKAGVKNNDLVQIYCSFIRSAIEYGTNVYSGYLTKEQENQIERIQANIVNTIFPSRSYRECLLKAKIPTLKKRRELNFLKFARRIEANEYFRKRWLPLDDAPKYELRKSNKYKTMKYNCDRLANSPIFRVRDTLNAIHRSGENINEKIMKLEEDLLKFDEKENEIDFT